MGDQERRHGPLRAKTVVQAALALVDGGGLESLTMRRLATSLDAHLPTIYRLFDGKQALLDEMAETILAKALTHVPPDGADWAERTTALATGLRAAVLAQRDGARILGGNYAAKLNNLTFVETLVATMRNAGFVDETALWASSTIFCYVLGEALEQQGSVGGEIDDLVAALRGGGFPHLAASPVARMLDFDARFDFGLRVLLDGLRQALISSA